MSGVIKYLEGNGVLAEPLLREFRDKLRTAAAAPDPADSVKRLLRKVTLKIGKPVLSALPDNAREDANGLASTVRHATDPGAVRRTAARVAAAIDVFLIVHKGR